MKSGSGPSEWNGARILRGGGTVDWDTEEGGITRRGFIKRSLVVGSMVWAAPVVMDFGTLPAAQAFSGGSADVQPSETRIEDPPSTPRTDEPPAVQVKASTVRAPQPTAAVQAAQAETLPETGISADTLGITAAGLIGLGAVAARQGKTAERRQAETST